MMHWDVAIIGGGPAGLMAAARAAERGRKTILLEKNREPGVKILLSGGTRCNLTHATDARASLKRLDPTADSCTPPWPALGPQQGRRSLRVGRRAHENRAGRKVFPASDRAADVRNALLRRVKQNGCTLAMGETLVELYCSFSPGVLAGKNAPWTRRLNNAEFSNENNILPAFSWSQHTERSRRKKSSWSAEVNRIQPAEQPATDTAGRPPWGIVSWRRIQRSCRSPAMPLGY